MNKVVKLIKWGITLFQSGDDHSEWTRSDFGPLFK